MNKKDLWLRIATYQFDHLVPVHLLDAILARFGREHACAKAFTDKLCRKLHWGRAFALRALWEYKKFVYLGVISDSSVTPSKIIDQVWHEHLLFSAGYRKFCEEIIQYDFDHNPELVPVSSQTRVFQKQYFDTVALYEKEFGSQPPPDIWNTTKFTDDGAQKKRLKKQQDAASYGSDGGSDTLISMFPSADSNDCQFDGGAFGGGGASGEWGDGSGSGRDSGGASDGGTSCSSSCSGCSGGGD